MVENLKFSNKLWCSFNLAKFAFIRVISLCRSGHLQAEVEISLISCIIGVNAVLHTAIARIRPALQVLGEEDAKCRYIVNGSYPPQHNCILHCYWP